jgi:hypothetical protein
MMFIPIKAGKIDIQNIPEIPATNFMVALIFLTEDSVTLAGDVCLSTSAVCCSSLDVADVVLAVTATEEMARLCFRTR